MRRPSREQDLDLAAAVLGDAGAGDVDLGGLAQPLARSELAGDLVRHPDADLADAGQAPDLGDQDHFAGQVGEVVAVDDQAEGARFAAQPRALVEVVAGPVVAGLDDLAAHHAPTQLQGRRVADMLPEIGAQPVELGLDFGDRHQQFRQQRGDLPPGFDAGEVADDERAVAQRLDRVRGGRKPLLEDPEEPGDEGVEVDEHLVRLGPSGEAAHVDEYGYDAPVLSHSALRTSWPGIRVAHFVHISTVAGALIA